MKEERIETTELNNIENVNQQSDVEEVLTQDTSLAFADQNTEHVQENNDDVKTSRKKRVTKIVFTVLFIVVMAAIIAYTAVSDFTGESVNNDRVTELIGANWYYLIVLLGLFMLTILLEALKVFIMIRKTTNTYQFGTAFNCAALGKFYDYVTPLGAGGQPFQMYYLAKHGVPSGPAGAIPIGTLFLTQFSFLYAQ